LVLLELLKPKARVAIRRSGLQGGKAGNPKPEITLEVCPNGSFDEDMCRIDREISGDNN
jgi:hypothetical protein